MAVSLDTPTYAVPEEQLIPVGDFLRNLAPVREGPPGDMPQPIRLRVSARS